MAAISCQLATQQNNAFGNMSPTIELMEVTETTTTATEENFIFMDRVVCFLFWDRLRNEKRERVVKISRKEDRGFEALRVNN
jgi:hypothetical protein